MLDNIAYIVKKLEDFRYENSAIKGNLYNLSECDINNIIPLHEYVEECSVIGGGSIVVPDDYLSKVGKNIQIQVSTTNIPGYYDRYASFINKNKAAFYESDFYVRDIDYLYKNNSAQESSKKLDSYFKNVDLIKLLRSIADYEKEVGGDLELFFYRAEKGLVLKIDYNESDLDDLTIDNLTELEHHFSEKSDKEERRQIFINELIGLLKNDNTYEYLIKNWAMLKSGYEQSFKFYLSGFSFEQVKTASTEYFQKFKERIYSQISKSTVNIFIAPTAYIFFIKSFELSDGNTFSNILLLITACIFSVIMDMVIFKNMKDGLLTIKEDIRNFKNKIGTNLPKDSLKELEILESLDIQKQDKKIKILSWSNKILLVFAILSFLRAENLLDYPIINKAETETPLTTSYLP